MQSDSQPVGRDPNKSRSAGAKGNGSWSNAVGWLVGSSGIGAKPPSQPTGDGDYGIGFIYHHKKKKLGAEDRE